MAVSQQAMRVSRRHAIVGHEPGQPANGHRFTLKLPEKSAVGVALLVILVLFALIGPHYWTVPPQQQDLANGLSSPIALGGNGTHPLGADQLGRDTLALLLAGARTSLWIATISSLLGAIIGASLGLVSGFRGGLLRGAVDWAIDVQLTVPFVVVAIALTATFGNSFAALVATLVATGWLVYARVVQTQVQTLRQTEWVLAAHIMGASPFRIATHHLAPSILGTVGVLLTQQAGAMIFYEASLSFLGLGLGGNVVTLGGLVSQGRDAVFVAPWLAVFPGMVIAWAILGFNLLGDGNGNRGWRRAR